MSLRAYKLIWPDEVTGLQRGLSTDPPTPTPSSPSVSLGSAACLDLDADLELWQESLGPQAVSSGCCPESGWLVRAVFLLQALLCLAQRQRELTP